MTISVTPDNLGPVTVRAHVSADGIRVELFAPSDLGRDAIRAILPDLRRDLAVSGMTTNLDLSSNDQPTESGDEAPRGERFASKPRTGTSGDAPENPEQRKPGLYETSSTIDVLA